MYRLRVITLALILTQGACDAPRQPSAPRVNSQTVYVPIGDGTLASAAGDDVSLRKFSGRYLWVDFAAEWCAACTPQTHALQSVAASVPPGVVFLTVLTSERGGYGHPATRETAANWALRFGLDPARVLATDLSAMTLPRNILYSPAGQVLFDRTGAMNAGEIQSALEKYSSH